MRCPFSREMLVDRDYDSLKGNVGADLRRKCEKRYAKRLLKRGEGDIYHLAAVRGVWTGREWIWGMGLLHEDLAKPCLGRFRNQRGVMPVIELEAVVYRPDCLEAFLRGAGLKASEKIVVEHNGFRWGSIEEALAW